MPNGNYTEEEKKAFDYCVRTAIKTYTEAHELNPEIHAKDICKNPSILNKFLQRIQKIK